MWHVWETGDMNTGVLWANLWESDHLEDTSVDGKMILKLILKTVSDSVD